MRMQSPTLEQFLQLIFFPGQYQMKLRFNTELRHYRVLYDLKMEIKSSNKRKTDRPKEDREIYLTPRPCIVVSFRFPTPTRKESETRALLNSTQLNTDKEIQTPALQFSLTCPNSLPIYTESVWPGIFTYTALPLMKL